MAKRRSWRPAFAPENFAAATLVIAYAATVILVFPAFLRDVVPILRDTYLLSRAPAVDLWLAPTLLLQLAVMVMTLWLAGRRIVSSSAMLPLIGATGFALALIIQGKGYLNHGYPGDALSLLALAIVLGERHGDAGMRRFATIALLGLSAVELWMFAHIFQYDGLAELVRRVAPPHPRIIVAGGSLAVGHPLTRWVNGEWVGRSPSLWLTADVADLLERPPRRWTEAERMHLLRLAAKDAQQFTEDVVRGKPDVVLVEGVAGVRWIHAHPAVRAALADFRPAGEAADVSVWVRSRS